MTNPLTYYSKNGHLLFPLPPLSINKIEHLPKIVTEIIGISSSSLSLIKSPKSCLGPTLHIHPSFYLIFHLFFYHYSELFFFFLHHQCLVGHLLLFLSFLEFHATFHGQHQKSSKLHQTKVNENPNKYQMKDRKTNTLFLFTTT